ncbi:MAG: type II secretion system F family protein [Acidimicrobiales bacterium]
MTFSTAAVAVVATALALALVAWVLVDQAYERSAVKEAVRRLGPYEVVNVRDRELLVPFQQRILRPVLGAFTGLGRRFTPAGYVDRVRRKLVLSGRPNREALDLFLAVRSAGVLAVPVWALLCFKVLHLSGLIPICLFGLLTMVSVMGPDAVLNRRIAERQESIRTSLPDILDLLVISVEAGLGFEQALDRTVSSVPGPLSEEFIRMLNETRAGSARADAMRALDDRTGVEEVKSFVLAILQADTFGVSVGRVLRAQADEMRIKRRQLAQEKAQKAPIKMLIPMVFCIFPALFVVVIGPAIINVMHNFK